jgi:hypothetical protein
MLTLLQVKTFLPANIINSMVHGLCWELHSWKRNALLRNPGSSPTLFMKT